MSDTLASLPIVPLRSMILFPGLLLPISAGRPRTLAAVEAGMADEGKLLAVFAQRDAAAEEPAREDLYDFGTRAVVRRLQRAGDTVELIVQGVDRIRLVELEQVDPFLRARVMAVPVPLVGPAEPTTEERAQVEATKGAIVELAGRIVAVAGQSEADLQRLLGPIGDPLQMSFLLATMLNLELQKEQDLLEAPTQLEALRMMHGYLQHELEVARLRQSINSRVETEMTRERRDFMLRQQLRAIQKELGEQNPEQAEVAVLRDRLDAAELPEEVRREAERELSRLERLPAAAPDFQVTRGYVELILELPWTATTEDNLDLGHARAVLDEDHYGLQEIKERILEHLAVMRLNPGARAPILCLVGPPGVGKTSLGQSIARAMGRKFERTSLGGMHDEAELRGHRRTYVGAMPGRLIQAIRRARVGNPLLMLDEVDKLGRGFHGDPAAALMEILDPAQNDAFRDNYLDLPFDLSRVFFIVTANMLDTIPAPLLDRMETLRLSGYTREEKMQIARRYLLPRQVSQAGIPPERLDVSDGVLGKVIDAYTREAGVRQLERVLGRLARRIALRIAQGDDSALVLRADDLADLLGPERQAWERARADLPAGVATGLAWTEAGGDVLYVEALLHAGAGDGLILTGHLGDVMKESAQAARSYILSRAVPLGLTDEQRRSGVHIHVPAGAVPKDGPSAGVTMGAALASAYTGLPVRHDTAMTGEITLTGLVLPVGGIKEKVLAAHRAGMRRVILPQENLRDLRDVPEETRSQIEFVPVHSFEDVLREVIPALAARAVRLEQPAPDGSATANPK